MDKVFLVVCAKEPGRGYGRATCRGCEYNKRCAAPPDTMNRRGIMSELTLAKVTASALVAIGMYFANIPDEAFLLIGMMFLDFVMGNFVAIQESSWSPRIFGNGILRKMSALFMLAALSIVEKPLGFHFDLVRYFSDAAIVYEFLSAAQSHVRLHGPGWQWIAALTKKIERTLENRRAVYIEQTTARIVEQTKP